MASIGRNCVHGSGFLGECEPIRDRFILMARASRGNVITGGNTEAVAAGVCLLSRTLVVQGLCGWMMELVVAWHLPPAAPKTWGIYQPFEWVKTIKVSFLR